MALAACRLQAHQRGGRLFVERIELGESFQRGQGGARVAITLRAGGCGEQQFRQAPAQPLAGLVRPGLKAILGEQVAGVQGEGSLGVAGSSGGLECRDVGPH